MASRRGAAELLPTAAPVPPSTFTIAEMFVAGLGASALKRSTISEPLPWTGSSGLAMTFSWALPPFVSISGPPAAAGITSPTVALMSCNAVESKRNCERRRVMPAGELQSHLELITYLRLSGPVQAERRARRGRSRVGVPAACRRARVGSRVVAGCSRRFARRRDRPRYRPGR